MRLSDYISGTRRGKEANRLEKKALRDPFLRDAMEGYDLLKDNPDPTIDILRKRVRIRTTRTRRNIAFFSAAASLLVLILAGSYFLFIMEQTSRSDMLSYDQEIPMMEEEIQTPVIPFPPAAASMPEELQSEIIRIPDEPIHIVEIQAISDMDSEFDEIQEEILSSQEQSDGSTSQQRSAKQQERAKAKEETQYRYDGTKTTTGKAVSQGNIYIAGNGHVFGSVIDESGEPVIGASVTVKGTTQGTITDIDGFFELRTQIGNELNIAYIGYETLTIPVREGSTNIAMHESSQLLEEVVVTGYGTVRKSTVTGSVSTVQAESLERQSKPSPVIGRRAYKKYITENIEYPEEEGCRNKKGKVKLRFSIDSYGRPTDIRIVKSLCEQADEEAIRLIEDGPDWTIGDREVTYKIKFR